MAITRATDLAVAKSDGTAEMVAAACWDAANRLDPADAVAVSTRRALRRHATELLELHGIKADEVLVATGDVRVGNGRVELLPDAPPTYNES